MRKFPLLLLLALPFAGCQSDHHKDKDKNPYTEWERKQEADDDHQFFGTGWINPTEHDNDEPMVPGPHGIAGPPH